MTIQSSRYDLQLPRRLFHMGCGLTVAAFYHMFFSHSEAVYLLGFIACLIYTFEQVRLNYPEIASRFELYSKYLLRAEEQLKESAQMPYIMGVLLTILSFPKPIALVAICILAVADPLSALVGIQFGKTKIGPRKSLQGSIAFFVSSFVCAAYCLSLYHPFDFNVFGLSICVAIIVTGFELIPIRIDDNLTIPLFSAAITWLLSWPWSVSTNIL
jgi:diacylglycerol kinase (CTP)